MIVYHLGPVLGYVGPVLDHLGHDFNHLGPVLGHLLPVLSLSWLSWTPWFLRVHETPCLPTKYGLLLTKHHACRQDLQNYPQKDPRDSPELIDFRDHFGVLFGTFFGIDFLIVFGRLLSNFWAPLRSILCPRSALGVPRQSPKSCQEHQSNEKLHFPKTLKFFCSFLRFLESRGLPREP